MKDGGPAFPNHPGVDPAGPNGGMTLRDYFAGQVIAQFFACNITLVVHGGKAQEADAMARDAYKLADAMIAAREGKSA